MSTFSDVFGRFRTAFGRFWTAFGRFRTAFGYRGQRFADRPYPFLFSFFLGGEAPNKKCMKPKLAHGG